MFLYVPKGPFQQILTLLFKTLSITKLLTIFTLRIKNMCYFICTTFYIFSQTISSHIMIVLSLKGSKITFPNVTLPKMGAFSNPLKQVRRWSHLSWWDLSLEIMHRRASTQPTQLHYSNFKITYFQKDENTNKISWPNQLGLFSVSTSPPKKWWLGMSAQN
jgi:hypothetical protein